MKKTAVIFSLVMISLVHAQEALKSTEEEYYDFLSLQGITVRPTLNYRTLSDSEWSIAETEDGAEAEHPWQDNNLGTKQILFKPDAAADNAFARGIDQSIALKIYGLEWFNSYNTAAPYGQNDGALWQGKGYNTSLTAGARLEGYGLEVTFKPQVSFSQNREFDFLPGVYGSEYSYFWKGNIDLVQRYGDSSFWTFDWGDTEIRYTWHTLTAGFGTQAIWLGPAWLNPMLGSNNAPAYPKFDIGLRRTKVYLPWLGWYIGDIEGRAWLGCLMESDYFDNNPDNDRRQLTGFSAAYSPSFLPGFTIGGTKVCINDWQNKSIKYLNPLYSTNGSQTADGIDEDQKMSLFADWIFPQVGFEVYGELGIDDYSAHKLENPFHTAIYTVGAKKSLTISKKHGIHGEIIFEWNNFEMSQDFQLQWKYMGYYSHGSIAQGYTQNGQILGAGSGYFGNSQFLGFKVYYQKGSAMLFVHYNRPDTNYVNNIGVEMSQNDWVNAGKSEHDMWAKYKAMRTYGFAAQYFIMPSLLVGGEFNWSWIVNDHSENNDRASYRNWHFALNMKYSF